LTIEVIEAESQAVLNTLTKTTSRMHLRNGRSTRNERGMRFEGDYFDGEWLVYAENY
jgi:hypothetical protein